MTVHQLPVRVYYEDTDAGSVVYHARYLGFAERARTEMLRDGGYVHSELLKEKGIAFAVRHLDIDFKKAATLDDLLMIESKVVRIGGASFDVAQTIKRDGDVIADLKVVLVCMDVETLSARRLPEEIRTLFEGMIKDKEEEIAYV